MVLHDNANLTTFLLNAPVEIYSTDETKDEQSFELLLRQPTIKQLYSDRKLQIVLGILNTPLDKLSTQFSFITNFTYLHFFIVVGTLQDNIPQLKLYWDYFVYVLNILGVEVVLDGTTLLLNKQPINDTIFDYIRTVILMMTKIKSRSDSLLEKDERFKSSQDLIAKIKGQNKSGDKSDINFEKNFITLIYEFGLTPEEINNLNIYQYESILSYTSSAVQSQVSIIGAGNGLSKKVKYITEGKKKNG